MTDTARQLPRTATQAEIKLWEILRNRRCGELKFLRQVPAGQYVLDFYCASVRLAIEVDGSIHDLPEVALRDTDRQTALTEELGITFLRLTNEEVLSTPEEELTTRIKAATDLAAQQVPAWAARPARRR